MKVGAAVSNARSEINTSLRRCVVNETRRGSLRLRAIMEVSLRVRRTCFPPGSGSALANCCPCD